MSLSGEWGAVASSYATDKANDAQKRALDQAKDMQREAMDFWTEPDHFNGILSFTDRAGKQEANNELAYEKGRTLQSIDLLPQISKAQAGADKTAREANLSDLSALGTKYNQALAKSNPMFGRALSKINSLVNTAGTTDALGQELNRRALSELKAGGKLTAEQLRDTTQGTRSAFADRGIAMSNSAMGAELLARDQYSRQRLAQAQAQAQQVELLNEARLSNTRGFLGSAAATGQNANAQMLSVFGLNGVPVGTGSQMGQGPSVIGAGAQTANVANNYLGNILQAGNGVADQYTNQSNMWGGIARGAMANSGQGLANVSAGIGMAKSLGWLGNSGAAAAAV